MRPYDAFRYASRLIEQCGDREEFDVCVWLMCHVMQFVAMHAVAIGMDPTWATEQFRFDGEGPVVVPAHRREMVSLVDISATVLRLANVGRNGVEGQSFLPLLRDQDAARWVGRLEIIGQ